MKNLIWAVVATAVGVYAFAPPGALSGLGVYLPGRGPDFKVWIEHTRAMGYMTKVRSMDHRTLVVTGVTIDGKDEDISGWKPHKYLDTHLAGSNPPVPMEEKTTEDLTTMKLGDERSFWGENPVEVIIKTDHGSSTYQFRD